MANWAVHAYGKNEISEMIASWVAPERVPLKFNVVTDTSDFFRVNYDDVLLLNNRPYLVRNTAKEGRFGLDDEPKFWVRRAIDLIDGTRKIIKMVYHEDFKLRVGQVVFKCVRSPRKEARILDKVRGHERFMQGYSVTDPAGNNVRIIDRIKGRRLDDVMADLSLSHEDYFANYFPSFLDEFIELVKAIEFLHDQGEKHGDVRRDHLILDSEVNHYRWIDFDFNYIHRENRFGYDLFGLGNILAYIVGQGDVTLHDLMESHAPVLDQLTDEDLNIIFRNRVINLKKVFPYIPDSLDYVLRHFSLGANVFYEQTSRFLSDVRAVRRDLR
jgi:hypothetical protein